jgi:hypothetical protein
MNMRKFIPIIFAISALFTLILCSACTLLPSANQTSQTGRLAQVSEPVESQYINFDVARRNLPAYQLDPDHVTSFITTAYYIIGIDVDGSGNSRNWIFGVRSTNGTEMLAYDGKSWITIPWNAPPDLEEMSVDSIVSPARLFSQNTAVILGNSPPAIPERRDLELKQGLYTLTITSGSTTRIVTFNATTGELIIQP